jgi:hypothetical protein
MASIVIGTEAIALEVKKEDLPSHQSITRRPMHSDPEDNNHAMDECPSFILKIMTNLSSARRAFQRLFSALAQG